MGSILFVLVFAELTLCFLWTHGARAHVDLPDKIVSTASAHLSPSSVRETESLESEVALSTTVLLEESTPAQYHVTPTAKVTSTSVQPKVVTFSDAVPVEVDEFLASRQASKVRPWWKKMWKKVKKASRKAKQLAQPVISILGNVGSGVKWAVTSLYSTYMSWWEHLLNGAANGDLDESASYLEASSNGTVTPKSLWGAMKHVLNGKVIKKYWEAFLRMVSSFFHRNRSEDATEKKTNAVNDVPNSTSDMTDKIPHTADFTQNRISSLLTLNLWSGVGKGRGRRGRGSGRGSQRRSGRGSQRRSGRGSQRRSVRFQNSERSFGPGGFQNPQPGFAQPPFTMQPSAQPLGVQQTLVNPYFPPQQLAAQDGNVQHQRALQGQALLARGYSGEQLHKMGYDIGAHTEPIEDEDPDPEPEEMTRRRRKKKKGLPKFVKLVVCIIADIIGIATYIVPGVGEFADVVWAFVQGTMMWKLFRSFKGAVFGFFEEILPFTDVIPSFTLSWYGQFGKGGLAKLVRKIGFGADMSEEEDEAV